MSGGFWAGSIPGWAIVIGCCLIILGALFGLWVGWCLGERCAVEDARWEREQAKARRTRPAGRRTYGGTVMPYRPWPDEGNNIPSPAKPGEIAHEWEPAHIAQALALVRDDLTDSAYTQDMAERMDRFLAGLFAVPYSADELWSGQ